MSTLTQETKDVNDELWALLAKAHHACTRPIALSGNCREFVSMLLELRNQLALYFALEESYSYFDDPVNVPLHTDYWGEQLRSEHFRLYSHFSDIVQQAETMLAEKQQAFWESRVPRQFLAFHEELMIHEHRENELLIAMLDQDIGISD